MRFSIKELDGRFWVIDDAYGNDHIITKLTLPTKEDAELLRNWLNENVNGLSFNDKVKKVIDELWDEDEIIVDEYVGYVSVTEIKETMITSADIRAEINCHVNTTTISAGKNLYKIMEA